VCPSCLEDPPWFEAGTFCARCRTPFLNDAPLDEDGLCRICRAGATEFEAAYCYGAYEGKLRDLIHLFKYQGIRPLEKPLGRWMARAVPRELKADAVVPVPMHWFKRLQRGFNQSELLARAVSRHTGLPLLAALRRTKRTPPQASLRRSERRRNMTTAFSTSAEAPVSGLRLLLIDDVMTTGATVNACARTLKRAGAAHVSVLTLARADRRVRFGEFSTDSVVNSNQGANE
jgi:ComF family protein